MTGTASLVLLLRRPDGISAPAFHTAWTGSGLTNLRSPLVVRHEHFQTRTDHERDGRSLPEFVVPGYDGIAFVSADGPARLSQLLASRELRDALGDLGSWADLDASHAVLTRDRVAFGPGDGDVVTLGCLRRHTQHSWNEFDRRWLAHARLTDGLRESGLLGGYVQSHLPRPATTTPSFRVGDVELSWSPWDGVTRGFWIDDDALARRSELSTWAAECAEDERQFIDHARSCHHLTHRTTII